MLSKCPSVFYRKESYFIPGTYYWTCPIGIDWIKLTVIGGGGAGGSIQMGGGGGGGAGGFFQINLRTYPDFIYFFIVGQGGIPNVDLGNGIGNGTSSSFGIANERTLGISYYGTSPNTNCGPTISGQGIGGKVDCLYAYLSFTGGNGGYGSYNHPVNRGGGGGGGIGLANGANGVDTPNTVPQAAGGSGAGAFGGHAGKSVIGQTTNECFSGGGGGIGYVGGDASSSLKMAGGGAGVYGPGYPGFGGPDYDGKLQNIGENATDNKGGGGGPKNGLGSGFLPTLAIPSDLLPPTAKLFYDIFGCISGSAGGSFLNTALSGSTGTASQCGGGTGAVSSQTINPYGYAGGNSYICGGGGGAVGNQSIISANYSIGGNGGIGCGGGGGAIGGNGGNGLIILEF